MARERQTFLVHVLDGGPVAIVENVTSRERERVADVRRVGEAIAGWARAAGEPAHAGPPDSGHSAQSGKRDAR